MKTDDPLLTAVLDEAADFREATRRGIRSHAHRRLRGRKLRRAAACIAVTTAVAFLMFPRSPTIAPPAVASAPAYEIVPTQQGLFTLVPRQPEGLRLVATTPGGIDVFETRTRLAQLAFLDDRQLFASFPGRRVAIVDAGTASARLIIY